MEEIKAIHDSQNIKYRSPFGAVDEGQKVKVLLTLNIEATVYLHLRYFNGKQHDVEMNRVYNVDKDFNTFVGYINTNNSIGLINYYFKIVYGTKVFYYGNNDDVLGGIGRLYYNNPKEYQITVYKKRAVPAWYKEGIIYQIFVDRFFNGNDDGKVNNPKKNSFIYSRWEDDPMYIKDKDGKVVRWDFYGGNLKGIEKKLGHIKDLGASIIYLNPIFESSSCHKYDTGDYERIDSMFGTEEDFKNLCDEAEKMGIKIILDGVFSHTGADSKYFNKYGNYHEIGAYQSNESPYYSWYNFNEYPHNYESWWGIDNMPNVDELNPSYLDYIVTGKNSIIEKWMNLGASGWRLDVADELPDLFICKIKEKMLATKNDSVLIGEVWEDASNKVSYSKRREYLFGNELDSVINYPLKDIIINFLNGRLKSTIFIKRFMSLYENYPSDNFYSCMNVLGTHDTRRIFTEVGENTELLKLAILLQMTLPGVPLIYYGDEVGLTGEKDPDNRKPYPWDNHNNKILSYYKKFISIRNNSEIIKKGSFKGLESQDDVLIYEREYKDTKIIVVINSSGKNVNLKLSNIYKIFESLEDSNRYVPVGGILDLSVSAYGYKIIKSI